jgi:DNA-binding winged helix-turn-helix (wHTH) protein
LASRINSARLAIGDTGDRQQWIRTIARKGFRFVGEVHERLASAAASTSEPLIVEAYRKPGASTRAA